ncbi:MAG: hypothetical protein QXY80_06280 [Candidatus Jordarchaeales archaeon]
MATITLEETKWEIILKDSSIQQALLNSHGKPEEERRKHNKKIIMQQGPISEKLK